MDEIEIEPIIDRELEAANERRRKFRELIEKDTQTKLGIERLVQEVDRDEGPEPMATMVRSW